MGDWHPAPVWFGGWRQVKRAWSVSLHTGTPDADLHSCVIEFCRSQMPVQRCQIPSETKRNSVYVNWEMRDMVSDGFWCRCGSVQGLWGEVFFSCPSQPSTLENHEWQESDNVFFRCCEIQYYKFWEIKAPVQWAAFSSQTFSRICSWMKGKIMFAGCNSGDLSCGFSSPKLGCRSVNLCLQVALAANCHLALADVTKGIRKMGWSQEAFESV